MIPDINMVREKALAKAKNANESNGKLDLIFKTINHFYDELSAYMNDQLRGGSFASCKLEYWAIRGYMQNTLRVELDNDEYFEILDAIFNKIQMEYTSAGYTVFVKKVVGTQINFCAYYESYYRCQIRF